MNHLQQRHADLDTFLLLFARRRLCEHIDAADSWITRCKAAVGKEARDLKKLLSLANEADAMPIRLAHECGLLVCPFVSVP